MIAAQTILAVFASVYELVLTAEQTHSSLAVMAQESLSGETADYAHLIAEKECCHHSIIPIRRTVWCQAPG